MTTQSKKSPAPKTITEIYKLIPPKPVILENEINLPKEIPNASEIFGIEIELEKITKTFLYDRRIWLLDKDGSLKDNGYEYKLLPSYLYTISIRLTEFFKELRLINKQSNFSPRCSLHIHQNVCDLTTTQLRSLCLIYISIEKLFFNYWNESPREKSVFCVPWYNIITFPILSNNLYVGEKYSALNLGRLKDLGTVEWRHSPGTFDVEKIIIWLHLIAKVKEYAIKYEEKDILKQLITLNSISNYQEFLLNIFGQDLIQLSIFKETNPQQNISRRVDRVLTYFAEQNYIEVQKHPNIYIAPTFFNKQNINKNEKLPQLFNEPVHIQEIATEQRINNTRNTFIPPPPIRPMTHEVQTLIIDDIEQPITDRIRDTTNDF